MENQEEPIRPRLPTVEFATKQTEYTMYLRTYAQGLIGASYIVGSPEERMAAAAALGGFDGKRSAPIMSKPVFVKTMASLFPAESEG